MRFMIYGADQKTGREMTIVVDAPDATEAERRAMYNDVLVSSVARFTADAARTNAGAERAATMLAYRPVELPPERRGAKPPHPASAVPAYREVVRGARWLDWIGLLARWGGALAIVFGISVAAIGFVAPLRERLALSDRPVLYAAAGLAATVLGLLCVLCGVMVSMTSGLVVAVRDIAQNTFHVATAAANPAPPPAGPTGSDGPRVVRRTLGSVDPFALQAAGERTPPPLLPPAEDNEVRAAAA